MKITFTNELLTLYVENRMIDTFDLRKTGLIKHIDNLLVDYDDFKYYFVKDENLIIIPLINIHDSSIKEIKFLS